jgi:hypothetical protein
VLAQSIIVAFLVIGCSVYAAWRLMPKAARRALARRLLELPLPSGVAGSLQKQLAPDNACGCDGCDKGTKAPPAPKASAAQPITFHPRIKR